MMSLSNASSVCSNELNLFKRDLHNLDNIDQAATVLGEQNLDRRKRDVQLDIDFFATTQS